MNDNKELIQFFNSKYSELKTRLSWWKLKLIEYYLNFLEKP
jgi:hypothetical protein